MTPEQQQAIANAKARLAAQTPSPSDGLGRQATRLGRNVAKTVASIYDVPKEIIADPILDTIAWGAEKLGGKEYPRQLREFTAYPTASDIVGQSYDNLTGGEGAPRNASERITDAASEALLGGGGLGALAKIGGATPAIVDALGVQTTSSAFGNAGAGAGAQAVAEETDNPWLQLLGGLAGGEVAPAAAGTPRAVVKGTAKAFGINPQKVAEIERAGLPLNIPAASDSPAVKGLANLSSQLPFGGKIRKSMNEAFDKAETAIKSLGYTGGKNTPVTAGGVVENAFDRWKTESVKRFKDADEQFKNIVPDTTLVDVSDLPEVTLNIAHSLGLTPRQIRENMGHPALQRMQQLHKDSQSAMSRFAQLSDDELLNIKKYESTDVSKLYDLRDHLIESVETGAKDYQGKMKIPNKYWDEIPTEDLSQPWLHGDGLNAAAGEAAHIPGVNKQIQQKQALLKEVDDAIAEKLASTDGKVPFNALKFDRSKIGRMKRNDLGVLTKDPITDSAYGAMSKLMERAAKNVGGDDAALAWRRRNKLWETYVDEHNNFIGKLKEKLGDTPEAIYTKLTSGNKVGAGNAKRVLRQLNPAERDVVRDAVIYQKGGAENFTIGKWAQEYQNMSTDARDAFFHGRPELKSAHESLLKGVEHYKDVGRFGNPSRSGYINHLGKFITGGSAAVAAVGGIPAALGGVALSAATNATLSTLLASPRATKLMARALIATDEKSYSRIVPALIKAMIGAGMTEEEAKQVVTPPQSQGMPDTPASKPPPATTFTPQQQEILQRARQRLLDSQQPTPASPPQSSPGDRGGMVVTPPPVIDPIQQNEGLRHQSYNDTEGNRTVGYGFNFNSGIARKVWKQAGIEAGFDDVHNGAAAITNDQAQRLFHASRYIAAADAKAFFPKIEELSPARQQALLDMSYNLGLPRLSEFSGLKSALEKGNYNRAAGAIWNSKYAKQVPDRARKIALQIMKG